jgi:hypothetical protein
LRVHAEKQRLQVESINITRQAMLQHGDILHYKAKGLRRVFAGFNPMRTAIFVEVFGVDLVAIYHKGEVKLVQFKWFSENYQFVSSHPEKWIVDPLHEIALRLGMSYKNENVLFGEIIGAVDFWNFKEGDIIKLCIEKGWLN